MSKQNDPSPTTAEYGCVLMLIALLVTPISISIAIFRYIAKHAPLIMIACAILIVVILIYLKA